MTLGNKKAGIFIFFGDILFFLISLWLSLYVRNLAIPSFDFYLSHLFPFSLIFILWLLVFYIAGLYDKRVLLLVSTLPEVIFKSQTVNSTIAILFFYLIPFFGITPKTILFIHLVIYFFLLVFWRLYGVNLFYKTERSPALLIGSGSDMHDLFNEVNKNERYNIRFLSSIDINDLDAIDIQEEVVRRIYADDIKLVAIDFSNEKISPLLPHLYNLVFSKVRFIDSHKIYEDVFDRIPLSLVTYSWFLENISVSPKFTYDVLKRLTDVVVSFVLGMTSFIIYPFVYLAIKLDDGGDIFIYQERIGQGGRIIKIVKFRTMTVNDSGEGQMDREKKITKVGGFLRKTRIDELPQLFNVLFGDISLIGPRPELPNLVKLYEKDISFYNVRHLIKPGLSGWAQLYQKDPPKFSTDYNQTKIKLSYDLFYIKNRSFLLDIKIGLKTIKTLLSRSGV
jgi:lipopolysaccharide/colanic/teichoic acid biosynthesis glycosyltransferase